MPPPSLHILLSTPEVRGALRFRTASGVRRLKLRKQKSRPIRTRLLAWLERQQSLHPPKSPIAVAIRYVLKRWTDLGRFLEDGRVPLDNNASERAPRPIAPGPEELSVCRRPRGRGEHRWTVHNHCDP